MKRLSKKIVPIILALIILLSPFGSLGNSEAAAAVPKISYQAHVQGDGWLSTVKNGATAGTTGQSKRLEGIKISLKSGSTNMIQYRAHIQDEGWQSWKTSGKLAGSTGKSRRMEAIQIKLVGTYAKKYDVYYRVHVAGFGWLGWAKNGETAGSTGAGLRMEAIQIKLVTKGTKISNSVRADITKTDLTYKAHVADKGWLGQVAEGKTAGTTGESKRMEALIINLKDYNGSSGISYRAHVAQIGWQSWVTSGQTAGTTGQSKQMEAIQIKLTGTIANYYNVYYRAHVAGYGWLGWACNGATAGTTGGGIRAEAIEIKLVSKAVSFSTGGAAYIDGTKVSTGIHLTHHMSGSLDQNAYNLYNYSGTANWGCCATAYATGLSIITGQSYNPESFWYGQTTHYTQGHVGNTTAFDANAIYNNLLAGKPTMVHYEYYKGDYTSEHWVLIIGVRDGAQQNSLQYSDFTVIDPWGGAEKNLTSIGYWGSTYNIEMRLMN